MSEWINIKDVIPATEKDVLLFGKGKMGESIFIGKLGGITNSVEFTQDDSGVDAYRSCNPLDALT